MKRDDMYVFRSSLYRITQHDDTFQTTFCMMTFKWVNLLYNLL